MTHLQRLCRLEYITHVRCACVPLVVWMMQAAEAAHAAECDRIRAENAVVADLHTQEIARKRLKEAQYKKVRKHVCTCACVHA